MITESQILIELFKFDKSLIEFGQPVNDDRFEKLEDQLGFELPSSFKSVMKKFNSISLDGTEINGLGKEFRGASLDKLYEVEHNEVGNPMPKELLPFSADGRGNHYCFDLSIKSDKVFFWQHDRDYSSKVEIEVCNENFLDWIKDVMIEWTLEDFNQKEFSEALPRGLAEKFEKRQVFQVGM